MHRNFHNMKRDINLFIQDILENIKDIESFSKGLAKEKFESNKLIQNAVIRSLEIIGESAKKILSEKSVQKFHGEKLLDSEIY